MNTKNNLPDPITRTEQYLSKAATGEGETPTPITRTEQYLDAIAQGGGGGGFTPTPTQLEAINSGINASLVARTILAPLTTPTEPVLLGVDETNSEAQFKLGSGLSVEGDTSPYTIKASGGMPIENRYSPSGSIDVEWDTQYYLWGNTYFITGINISDSIDSTEGIAEVHEIRFFIYSPTGTGIFNLVLNTTGNMVFDDGTDTKTFFLDRGNILYEFSIVPIGVHAINVAYREASDD